MPTAGSSPASRRQTSRCSRTASRRRSRCSPSSTCRSSAPSGRCLPRAPIEPDVSTNLAGLDGRIYLIVLDDLHTNPQRTPRAGRRPASSSSVTSAPTTWWPSCTPAAAATPARSSPPTSACCCRPSTSSWAASSARPPSNRIDEAYMTAGVSAAGRARRRHRRPRTRLPGPQCARLDEEAGRVSRRRQRPPQGAGALQRGHRLRHHRSDQQPGRHGHHGLDARLAVGGHPGERGHLRRRPARPGRPRAGEHRGGVVPGRQFARHQQPERSRTNCGSARTACACCRTKPAASRSSTATISRTPSSASSTTTARTTCSATIRANDRRDGVPQDRGEDEPPRAQIRARKGYIAPRGRAPRRSPPVPTTPRPSCATP
jgi:hypothetical protein